MILQVLVCMCFLAIDLCAEGKNDCQQICISSPGSFTCDCNQGYLLNDDKKTCSRQSRTLTQTLHYMLQFNKCKINCCFYINLNLVCMNSCQTGFLLKLKFGSFNLLNSEQFVLARRFCLFNSVCFQDGKKRLEPISSHSWHYYFMNICTS